MLDISASQSDGTAAFIGAASIGYDVPNNSYFPGSIDDVSVYGTALSADQIAAHFNTATPPVSTPQNTTLPTVTGTAQALLTLSASRGLWSGPAWTYAYQWRRCDTNGLACLDIAGATAQSYVLAGADVGATIRVAVTASNSLGSGSATSAQTLEVIPNNPPANSTAPAITGTAVDGWPLAVSDGTWTNSPTSLSYQWRRCGLSGSPCFDIAGATANSYTSTPDDDDRVLKAIVSAVNSGGVGSATATSAAIAGRTQIEPPPPGFGASMSVLSRRSLARTASCPSAWSDFNGPYIIAYKWNCDGSLYVMPKAGYGFYTDIIKQCLPIGGWPWSTCRDNGTSCNGANGHCLDMAMEMWDDFGPRNFAGAPGALRDYYANPTSCDLDAPQTICLKRVVGGLPPAQAGGACNSDLHATDSSECDGDPVNSFTGGFRYAAEDLALTGIGPALTIDRYYSSENPSNRYFGRGWAFSYGASLYVYGSGDVVLDGENGQKVFYYLQGGVYTSVGATSTLTAVTGGYDLTRNDQVVYHFNSAGRLLTVTDRNARQITLTRDANGVLAEITDSVGRSISVTTKNNGLIASIALPDGRSVGYHYTNNRLTSVTDVRGGTTAYTYNPDGLIATVVDPNGHTVVQNAYNAAGRVVSQTDANNKQTSFSWSDATQTLTATDARGNAWQDVYEHGNLIRRVDPLNNTSIYTYDSQFNRTSATDPRGNTSTATYDNHADVLTAAAPAPLSYLETAVYNARNDVTSSTDGRSNATSYSYDTAGNLTGITRPGGATIQFGRGAGGSLVSSVTSARTKKTTLGYDALGHPTSVTSPLGSSTTMGYDSAGRVSSIVEPRGNASGATPNDYKTTYTYNAASQVLTATDPLGHQSSWAYDSVGNPTSRTDANNHTTSYAYDAADHLISVTATGGAVTSYTYDNVGNVLTKTDPKSHTTTFAYDAANRLITVTTALSRVWTFGYDANGNVTSVVDANGNATGTVGDGTTTYAYDVLNRLTSIAYSDGTASVGYTYDANGNRTQMVDGDGTQSSTFNVRDELTQVARGTDSFGYSYDADGNVSQRTYPGGRQTDYTYTDDGQMATVASGGATTSYTYDPAGELTRTDLPSSNGYAETRTYNRAGLLTEVRNANATATLSYADYAYDPVGNPTQVTTEDGLAALSYDNRDRLTEVCYQTSCPGSSDPFIRYAYDTVGNRTSEIRPTGTATSSYDAADQLTSTNGPNGTTSYTFDSDGRQTQAGTRSFAWSLAERLTSTSDSSATTTYSYDGDGNRTLASSGSLAAEKTKYLWDANNGLPQLAVERDGNDAQLRSYLHGLDTVSMDSGEASYYFHRDGIGSIVNLTSAAGTTEWSYSYEPYGTAKDTTQNDSSAPANSLRFAGEYVDTASGLIDLRARQYDTTSGRFLSSDPLSASAGDPSSSTYVYGNNDPLSFIDPSGMGAIWDNGGRGCTGWDQLRCAAHFIPGYAANDLLGWHDNCERSTMCLLGITANVGVMLFPEGRAADELAAAAARRFTADQDALIQIAKDAKKRGGLTAEEGSILKDWATEYGLHARGPEAHEGLGFGSRDHYHVGPVGHIPAR